ncbi:MAG: TlpA disulfide reductase family protein [Bacillota bacterium]
MTEVLQLQPNLEKWRQNNFELLLVSSDPPGELKKFLSKNNLAVNVLLDSEFTAGKLYQVRGIPTDFLINEKGIIEHSFVGWGKNSLADLEDWVTKKS